jgi:pimeloyl-ACP methyl ester carboxylesterase
MVWRQYSLIHRELELAIQEQGPAAQKPIVALHGWRDNSASFNRLAQLLLDQRIIAPDFPGHGRSARRHAQASYSIWSYLEEVDVLVERHCPDGCVLLGHSMGGAVAALYAALYPERCAKLILLDTIGPLATQPQDAPAQLREAQQQLRTRKLNWRQHYPSYEAAVAARASRGLSELAAHALAERGVQQDGQGWYWDQDPRLAMKNAVSFTEEHSRVFLERIACPVLLVAAHSFWAGRMDWFEQRCGYFRDLERHVLDGSHHQHMEEQAPQVAALVGDFLLR